MKIEIYLDRLKVVITEECIAEDPDHIKKILVDLSRNGALTAGQYKALCDMAKVILGIKL